VRETALVVCPDREACGSEAPEDGDFSLVEREDGRPGSFKVPDPSIAERDGGETGEASREGKVEDLDNFFAPTGARSMGPCLSPAPALRGKLWESMPELLAFPLVGGGVATEAVALFFRSFSGTDGAGASGERDVALAETDFSTEGCGGFRAVG
jgi:hypothetical protein